MSADGSCVFVVDEDASARDSLACMLNAEGFETESYASTNEFFENAEVSNGGCALIGLPMPECGGVEFLNQIVNRFPQLPVIMMSEHGDVPSAVDSIKNGAWDFIKKPVDQEVILTSVRGAIAESASGCDHMHAIEKFKASVETLTRREREVYEFVIAGKTSREIAKLLYISARTVSAHRASIKAKTGTTSMAHLVRLSVQMSE
jgi:two-component system response regulator FixJ